MAPIIHTTKEAIQHLNKNGFSYYSMNVKPKINLIFSLEKIVIQTKTQNEYDGLMQIYECANLGLHGKPTDINFFDVYKEKTFIYVFPDNVITYGNVEDKFVADKKVISVQTFYNNQRLNSELVAEINGWFEQHKKDRLSKGWK